MCTLGGQLSFADLIWALLSSLWWWIVYGRSSLRSTPSSLTNEETAAYGSCVYLARLFVHDKLLCLDDGAGLSLVIHADDLGPQLKLSACRGWGQRLEELEQALAIDNTFGIELGNSGDGVATLSFVEINDFLRGLLERCPRVRSGTSE